MTVAAMTAIATATVVVGGMATVMAVMATAMAAVVAMKTAMAAMVTVTAAVAAMVTAMAMALTHSNQPKGGGNSSADEDLMDSGIGVLPPQICAGNR
jgi:hypothetical protein